MIETKLDKLPVDEKDRAPVADASADERRRRSRAGLSINDTIAAEANMSVGGRGVDTSGVEAGAGAGAGTTRTTPTTSSSAAPSIVPGARGSGTTVRGSARTDEIPTVRLNAERGAPTREEIAERAYQRWHGRGCPDGTPETDWFEAEEDLRSIPK